MFLKVLSGQTTTNSPPTNVSTFTFTTDTKANIVTGDLFIIDDGFDDPITFEFRKDGTAVTKSSYKLVDISTDTTAANVRDRLITAIGAATHPSTATGMASGAAIRVSAATSGNNVVITSLDWVRIPSTAGGHQVIKQSPGTNALATTQWSGSTQGFSMGNRNATNNLEGLENIDEVLALVRSTAGSGTMTVSMRLWVLSHTTRMWTPPGTGTDAAKGVFNAANSGSTYLMGETSADQITHAELIAGMSGFDRVYVEVTAINGTLTAVDCYLQTRGHGRNLPRG